MRGNDFLNKMELIDPVYVKAADTNAVKIKKKNTFATFGAMAACLCLAVVTAFAMKGAWNTPDEMGTNIPSLDTSGTIEYNEEHIITDLAIEPSTEPAADNNVFLPFIPSDGPHNTDSVDVTPLIASWCEGAYNVDVDANVNVDMAVSDGGVFLSDSLKAAMEHYGDTVNYRVLVELFDNGVQISSGSQLAIKECERLSELGYIVAMETVTQTEDNGEYMTTHITYYFTLHATHEQLKEFAASNELGYSLMLYGEYFGNTEIEEEIVFNCAMQ